MNILHKFTTKYEPKSTPNSLPIIWSKAEDCYVWDIHNRKYIDFTSGIFVTNCGHSNILIKNAIKNQLDKNLLYSYNYINFIKRNYEKELLKLTKFEKVYLLSTGAEAVECAIKLMRINGLKQNKYKNIIISFEDAMHGKTMLTDNLKHQLDWHFYDTNIYRLPFPQPISSFVKDLEVIRQRRGYKDIAGIILEGYQGWSARMYPKPYIEELISFCKKHNILVCFDEIQSGFGRTGKMFCYEHYDIKPDIVCIGKAMANGFPISGVLANSYILDLPNDLSSTYGGNILSCVAGMKVLEQIKSLIKNSEKLGNILSDRFNHMIVRYSNIIECNNQGLVGALIFKNKEIANKICHKALSKGLLLVNTGRESIKIGSPLTITKDILLKGLDILNKCIKET